MSMMMRCGVLLAMMRCWLVLSWYVAMLWMVFGRGMGLVIVRCMCCVVNGLCQVACSCCCCVVWMYPVIFLCW